MSMPPPLPPHPKSSVHVRFWGWWASPCSCYYHHPKSEHSCSILMVVDGVCRHTPATTTTPEIKHSCLILVGGGCLHAPASTTTPKIECSCSIFGVVGVSLLLPLPPPPKLSILARF